MNKVFFFIVCIFPMFLASGQTFKGKVLSAINNEPIAGVHIYLQKSKGGAISNKKGSFSLKVSEEDIVYFSHVAYEITSLVYHKNVNSIIYLNPVIQKINEVSLLKNKKLQSKIHFNTLASMKGNVHSFGALIIDHNIFVISGNVSHEVNSLAQAVADYPNLSFQEHLLKAKKYISFKGYSKNMMLYNIHQNKWSIADNTFRKRACHNIHYYDDKIFVIGGKRLSTNGLFEYLDDKIEVYDIKNKLIKIDNTNPHQAVNFASFIYKHNLIVMGGSTKLKRNAVKEYTNTVHLYDIKTGYWYELDNMPKSKETSGVLVDDKIYLIGGFNEFIQSTIESYDLISGEWKKEGDLFDGINRPAIAQNNHTIYFFENASMYTFNIKTRDLNEYRINLNLFASELFYADNKLYILGGYRLERFSKIPSSNLYSIDLAEFEKTSPFKSKKI